MQLQPLKFVPVYQQKIWGNRKFETLFNRQLPEGPIGESWDISTHEHGRSIVSAPKQLSGLSLGDLCRMYSQEILGKPDAQFPLLVKLIDADQPLSVQVHPDNDYAIRHESDMSGKNEMWYVLEAKENASIVYGLKPGTTKSDFSEAIANNDIKNYLNYVPVKAGDYFYIPAGVVHALGAGIVVAEIQQSSDLVYRLYDWDRVDENQKSRSLHIEQALEVINYDFNVQTKRSTTKSPILISSPFFTVEKLILKDKYTTLNSHNRFEVLINISPQAIIEVDAAGFDLKPGDSCLIPACCNQYRLLQAEANGCILRSYL